MELAAPAPLSVEEAVRDVASRFLESLPPSETSTVERLFGHIQQAHWFYVDEVVPLSGGALRKLSSWDFCEVLFRVCPMLEPYRSRSADFLAQYKAHLFTVPVYGAVLLSRDCRQVLLVRGAGARSWSFPRGKVNEGESGVACAVREVLEETGYDCRPALAWTSGGGGASGGAGGGSGAAVPHVLSPPQLHVKEGGKTVTMYVGVGVPNDGSLVFRPQTKSEIDEIGWFTTATLFALAGVAGSGGRADGDISRASVRALLPFLPGLHALLVKRGRWPATATAPSRPPAGPGTPYLVAPVAHAAATAAVVPPGVSGKAKPPAKAGKGKKGTRADAAASAAGGSPAASMATAPVAVRAGAGHPPPVPLPDAPDHLVAPLGSGVGDGGGGWSVSDMWATNAALLQKRFVYDGNPHTFGDDAVAAVPMITRAPAAPLTAPLAAPLPAGRGGRASGRTGSTASPVGPPGGQGAFAAPSGKKRAGAGAVGAAAVAVGVAPPAVSFDTPFRFDVAAILAAMALPSLGAAGSAS